MGGRRGLIVIVAALICALCTSGAAQAAPRLHVVLRTAPKSVRLGAAIVVRGSVTPTRRARTVILERQSTRTWLHVQTRRSTTRGAFAFSLRTKVARISRYRVVAGSGRRPLATSGTIRIVVRTPKPKLRTRPPVPAPAEVSLIATATLPAGTLGARYRTNLTTIDGRSGTWSIASGALPAGLALSASGQIKGIPSANGTSTFVVAFRDLNAVLSTRAFSIGITPPPAVTQVSAGTGAACALRVDGTVLCWGSYVWDQLGAPIPADAEFPYFPIAVSGLVDATAISVGGTHACAVRATGALVCWGTNGNGQLGDGTETTAPVPVAAQIMDVKAVSAGDSYTCAVRGDGSVWCWGSNARGALGSGDSQHLLPAQVAGVSGAIAVSAGATHTCALRADRTVACWGGNDHGELGNGTTTGSATPVMASGLSDAVSVTTGVDYTCALRTNGSVVCWGHGQFGALGNGSEADSSVPVAVSGLTDAVSVDAGYGTCAVRATGDTVCWGENDQGELGNGTNASSSSPVAVSGLAPATAVSAGTRFSCAVIPAHVACWGVNDAGEVAAPGGDGERVLSPVVVAGV